MINRDPYCGYPTYHSVYHPGGKSIIGIGWFIEGNYQAVSSYFSFESLSDYDKFKDRMIAVDLLLNYVYAVDIKFR